MTRDNATMDVPGKRRKGRTTRKGMNSIKHDSKRRDHRAERHKTGLHGGD